MKYHKRKETIKFMKSQRDDIEKNKLTEDGKTMETENF